MRVKTLKVRVRDKHAKMLSEQARAVNYVWNYINDLSEKSIRQRGQFLSAFDLHPYTKGSGKELGLHSQTLQCIASEYVARRRQFKKSRLRWRSSFGSRKSLGWIPINTGVAKWRNGQVYYNGSFFKVWDSYNLGQYKFKTASFNEDSRGRWYFNVTVEVVDQPSMGQDRIGIDLGLKTIATCSDGTELSGSWFRDYEDKLAIAQRAKKKNRVKAIHAKIRNKRNDALHKFSSKLISRCGEIYVGNVSSSKLAKTKMAKSVFDAGWFSLKTMLKYKSDHACIVYKEINEAYTTVTCSTCSARSGPSGLKGLRIRQWDCAECGAQNERDVNAAQNILNAALGHERLGEGIPAL